MKATASSVFQRKDSRWVALYKYNGKRIPVYGKTEENAIQKRLEKLNSLNGSLSQESGLNVNLSHEQENHITLGEWLSEWLDTSVKYIKSTSTYTGYEVYIYRHIIPLIGNVRLCDLTTAIFQDFFNDKAENGRLDGKLGGISPKSIENMRFMLNSSMRQALSIGLITENPIKNIRTKEVEKKDAVILNHDDQVRLITACNEYRNISSFGVVISVRAGLQLGELLALKWSDIDLVGKSISVHQFLNRHNNIINPNSKSSLQISNLKSERVINASDLPSGFDFFTEIEAYRNKQHDLFCDTPGFVVSSSIGGPIDPSNYNKLFKRLLAISEISTINFDVLRNTFAVRYLEQGFDPARLPRILGCIESSKTIDRVNRIINQAKN